jgi:hypothetical protein
VRAEAEASWARGQKRARWRLRPGLGGAGVGGSKSSDARSRRVDQARGERGAWSGGDQEELTCGGWAGFSRFALFRGRFFWVRPANFGVQTGFSRLGMLREKFVELGGNLKRKSAIPREIQGIGAIKFVAM